MQTFQFPANLKSWFGPSIKQSRGVAAALCISTIVLAASLLWLWHAPVDHERHINRYGESLSQMLASTSAGHLLHSDRIELTVIASDVARLPEVAGIIFYNAKNEILAVNGQADRGPHFTTPAALDDTITGYVSVVLAPEAFAAPTPWGRWLASVAALLIAPLLGLAYLRFANRGNASLPIVSVPEIEPQQCFCVAITLHNQMALDRADVQQAIYDAQTMAMEAGARHQGLCVEAGPRGVVMLFDEQAGALQSIHCAHLALRLLGEFETAGSFRAAIGQMEILGSVGDQSQLDASELERGTMDTLFTLAALAKPNAVIICDNVYGRLERAAQPLATTFQHPLVEDLLEEDVYVVNALDDEAEQWVAEQAELILGFTQTPSARA